MMCEVSILLHIGVTTGNQPHLRYECKQLLSKVGCYSSKPLDSQLLQDTHYDSEPQKKLC